MSRLRHAPELHHTAYLVADLDRSIRRWESLGATVESPAVSVPSDRVRAAFLGFKGGRIELVEPQPGSRVKLIPAKAGHPDHVCFLCRDFDERVAAARAEGGVVVRPPARSEAFLGKRMAFVLYRDVGLVEWVEA